MNEASAGHRRPVSLLVRLVSSLICSVALIAALAAASLSATAAPPDHPSTAQDGPRGEPQAQLDPIDASASAFQPVTTPDPIVRSMMDQVTTANLMRYVGDLSGEHSIVINTTPPYTYTIRTRRTNSGTPIQNASLYVGDHLAALGMTVEYQQWESASPPNVIGELTGETDPGRIYMVMAHLDDKPITGDIAPGADDNASGVAAVLAAADILSQYRWGCTLRFAVWTSEELYLKGSAAYATRAASRGENIAGALNLDMIGWNAPGSSPDMDLHARSTLPATLDIANQLVSVIDVYDLGITPTIYPDGTTSSDHASFWDKHYPAVLAMEDFFPLNGSNDFNPYFHTTNDLLAKLDQAYFTDMAKLAAGGLAHMSGCLLAGTLSGQVVSAHDGQAIAGASVSAADRAQHRYAITVADTGAYTLPLPAASYTVTAAAYGYLPSVVSGVTVAPDAVQTQPFGLQAAPPARPTVTASRVTGGFYLSWPHVPPNTAYRVHRSTAPYFIPTPGSQIDAVSMPFTEIVNYPDTTSGAGNPDVNHFYSVVGVNPDGQGAASHRIGEFDFWLTPGS